MSAPLRDIPEAALFALLAAALDSHSPAVRRIFLAAIVAGVTEAQGVDFASQAELALATGRYELLDNALNWSAFERKMLEAYAPGRPLAAVAGEGAYAAAKMLPRGLQRAAPGEAEQRILAWLSTHGSERVAALSEQTKAGLRRVLAGAWERIPGEDVEAARQRIRAVLRALGIGPFAGLNERQAEGFANQIAAWAAEPEMPDARLAELIRDRAAKLAEDRAETIAETELSEAANQGMVEAWKAAEAVGAPVVKLGEFVDRVGVVVKGERIYPKVARPPLHPHCRCLLRLEPAGQDADGRLIYRVEWVTMLTGVCPRCQEMDRQLAQSPVLEAAAA